MSEGEGPGFNLGGFLSRAIGEGWSQNRARAAFRDAGMKLGTESFNSMYGQARAALGRRDLVGGLDYGAIPPADAYGRYGTGEGKYSTFVTSYVRRTGERGVELRYFTHTTYGPHTPQDAIDAAADLYQGATDDAGGVYGGVFLGAFVTSVTRSA